MQALNQRAGKIISESELRTEKEADYHAADRDKQELPDDLEARIPLKGLRLATAQKGIHSLENDDRHRVVQSTCSRFRREASQNSVCVVGGPHIPARALALAMDLRGILGCCLGMLFSMNRH